MEANVFEEYSAWMVTTSHAVCAIRLHERQYQARQCMAIDADWMSHSM
jgi:hypothetical protein